MERRKATTALQQSWVYPPHHMNDSSGITTPTKRALTCSSIINRHHWVFFSFSCCFSRTCFMQCHSEIVDDKARIKNRSLLPCLCLCLASLSSLPAASTPARKVQKSKKKIPAKRSRKLRLPAHRGKKFTIQLRVIDGRHPPRHHDSPVASRRFNHHGQEKLVKSWVFSSSCYWTYPSSKVASGLFRNNEDLVKAVHNPTQGYPFLFFRGEWGRFAVHNTSYVMIDYLRNSKRQKFRNIGN